MTDQFRQEPPAQAMTESWRELRDERGRLWGRLEERQWLLEVRRNHESAIFNLRDLLEQIGLDDDRP